MSPTVQPATAQDDFWLDEPASIARVLRELARTRTPLLFEPAGIPTRLLLADEDRRACVLEWCRNGRELERLLNATGLSLRGSLGGTPIRFAAGTPEVTRLGNTPAFHIPLPARLQYLQARRHFRVRLAAARGFRCRREDEAGGPPLSLDIRDLSLSGVGLRVPLGLLAVFAPGRLLPDCTLDFGPFGIVQASLRVVRHGPATPQADARRKVGCIFVDLDAGTRRQLQRLVFALEVAPEIPLEAPLETPPA